MAQQKAVEPVQEVDDLIDELQPGAKLLKGQYTITRYINSGGFGITYLAKDSLDRDVVIKECFPSSVCRRSKVMVAARSRAHTAELRSIVQLFVREARNLAKIVHPNIVAVHQVFEDNGTAYMAIDFIDGLDLQQIIDGEGETLAPEHIVRIADKLLAAVGFIHDNDMLHRDISPDNVLVNKAGEPILIDFGAAREQASKTTRAMSALRVVKDGYSPQEFDIAGSEQGPWSDLYALGATLYHVISGEAPVNGQARLAALAEDKPDPYVRLAGRFEGYPPGFLEAIDRAMNTMPKARLQTAAEWLEMYHRPQAVAGTSVDAVVHKLVSEFQRETVAGTPAPPPPVKAASRPAEPVAVPGARGRSPVQMLAGIAVALIVVVGGYIMLGKPRAPAEDAVSAASAPSETAPAPVAQKLETAAAAVAPEPTLESPVEPASAPTPETSVESAEAAPEPSAEVTAASATVAPNEATTESPALATDLADTPAEAPETGPEAEVVAETEAPAEDVAAAPESAAEPAPVTGGTATAAGKPAANQIAFAAWDVAMPFLSDDRMVDGQRVAVVTRFQPGVDIKAAGDWLAPGVAIHSVNGVSVQSAGSLVVAVMNAMAVDPDGKARVVVEFSDRSRQVQSGLLTVDVIRLISLQNGVSARTRVVDGAWTTEVTGVADPETTTLRLGDTLFRDKTTTTPLDGATSLETILAALVETGVGETELSIIRDNKVVTATMRLVPEAAP
jgi:serine/threonine protein kinase